VPHLLLKLFLRQQAVGRLSEAEAERVKPVEVVCQSVLVLFVAWHVAPRPGSRSGTPVTARSGCSDPFALCGFLGRRDRGINTMPFQEWLLGPLMARILWPRASCLHHFVNAFMAGMLRSPDLAISDISFGAARFRRKLAIRREEHRE